MLKKDIIKDLAEKYELTQVEAKKIFDATFDELTEILARGDSFSETGFGAFSVNYLDERKGFNPMINKWMMLPPKLKPKFKSSDILKDKINNN